MLIWDSLIKWGKPVKKMDLKTEGLNQWQTIISGLEKKNTLIMLIQTLKIYNVLITKQLDKF